MDSSISQARVVAPHDVDMSLVTGPADVFVREIEQSFDARIGVRGDEIDIRGDSIEVDTLAALFNELFTQVRAGIVLSLPDVDRLIALAKNRDFSLQELRSDVILSHRGHVVRPKTAGQKRYVDAIRAHTITFAIGPAGTGKTYLACALALDALARKEVGRIVLTRPIVEAGENLGYLPGTLMEKVDPYMRPLYDALLDMSDAETVNRAVEEGVVEIAPLAFMRGRTLNDSFIILDEAQNTTPEQMKMFLTRLGFGSKMVITGDVTQIDLFGRPSGLLPMKRILAGIDDIAFCDFTGSDVVRHSLVSKIISAYRRFEKGEGDGHRD